LDLVNAETEMQQQQAIQQMEGSLSKIYKNWRENIIKCLANVEAYIDFSEEENVEDNVLEEGIFIFIISFRKLYQIISICGKSRNKS
jgi:tRNA U34 5-carboxymethylaminomethyl modifying GTPase MnmE/TrmE